MNSVRIFRRIAWAAVALAGGLLLAVSVVGLPGQTRNQAAVPSANLAAIGGPFELTSHNGERIGNARLAGKPYLVFFGFTHCPDVCPTTLFELSELMKELGSTADRFKVLFISVDPERDTQALLSEYLTSFDARILALRGSEAETNAAVKAFAAFARKVPTQSSYTMEHTAGVYLIDAKGKFAGMLDMHEPRETKLEKLRRLASEGF